MTLDHAANGNYRPANSIGLVPTSFDERIDGFLLRGIDEATRVDDNDVGFRKILRVLAAAGGKLPKISLGVDSVLVAAERDEANLHWRFAGETSRAIILRTAVSAVVAEL